MWAAVRRPSQQRKITILLSISVLLLILNDILPSSPLLSSSSAREEGEENSLKDKGGVGRG